MRLGDELVHSGVLSTDTLHFALQEQKRQDQKIGRILLANRFISDEDLVGALARQSGLGRLDLARDPCDPDLFRTLDAYRCLELEAAPWRIVGSTLIIAISNPELGRQVIEAFDDGILQIALALAKPSEIRREIVRNFTRQLRLDARLKCPEAFSCRGWTQALQHSWKARLPLLALCAAAIVLPKLMLQVLMVWILLANTATMALRLVAIFASVTRKRRSTAGAGAARIEDRRKLPRVSVIVPLLGEAAVARKLLDALRAMDYPAPLLDIKLVLEEDDLITRAAIASADLPPTTEVIVAPADGLKTKPRAMNYALPFCLGEIVGIYDAEDEPDPAQIRTIVEHLRTAPPDVACVQGFLDFYNARENWLSRCFTLEYAIWFRVVLHGVQRLGFPIPLGGTTVFFRRHILEQIGGWDAHNVTEDADLGMRLARFGYRCEMVASTTWEEANCHPFRWIKQRSRWLKGYIVTWATHMRDPRALIADLGWRGFTGFQILFLGAMTSYLALPLFWFLWIATTGFDMAFWNDYPQWMLACFFVSMVLGQVVMLTSAIIAALDTRRLFLLPWALTLVCYWPLGAIAAYRAIGEIFSRPSYWAKTEHGHSTVGSAYSEPAAAPVAFRPLVVWPPPEDGSRRPG